MELNIEIILNEITISLTPNELSLIELKYNTPSGVTYDVDGVNCVTSICFWGNGYCDIDYIYTSKPDKNHFEHYEFLTEKEVIKSITKEIKKAIQRATNKNT